VPANPFSLIIKFSIARPALMDVPKLLLWEFLILATTKRSYWRVTRLWTYCRHL